MSKPSANKGEEGESGERGERSSRAAGGLIVGLSGEVGGGAALRGGKVKSYCNDVGTKLVGFQRRVCMCAVPTLLELFNLKPTKPDLSDKECSLQACDAPSDFRNSSRIWVAP